MLDLSPLWISLRIAIVATAIAAILGTVAARFTHGYRGRWRSLFDAFFLAPIVLPPTVLGFLLLLLLGKNGPLGGLLANFGLNVVFTWYAAIVTATVVGFPLTYKTVLGALEQIDSNLQQAAKTLGASELRILWQVTLPLALPGIVAGTTLTFVRALGEFGATLMLAGNIPGKTQTIPMAIYFAVEAGAFREAIAWTGVILTIALGGLALANHWKARRQRGGQSRKRKDSAIARSPHPHHTTRETERACPLFAIFSHGAARPTIATIPIARPQPTSSSPYLSVEIVKRLPDFTLDVSFAVDRQPLGVLGASGAGKSLILRCIAGTETPDAGRIILNGRVLFDSEKGINVPSCDRRVGVLFQNYALFPHLTAAQNIAFGLPPGLNPRQKRQIVERNLATVQLQDLGDRLPKQLSGGQQQRVALARVLANQPEVLLLDEPFSALDTHLRYLIERDLRLHLERFPGITLFVTHNVEEAYRISDRLLIVDRGRTSILDSKYAVLDRPRTVCAARLTGCKNVSRAVRIAPDALCALDWNCTVRVLEPITQDITHLGMRAHQIEFLETASSVQREFDRPHAPSLALPEAEEGVANEPMLEASPRLAIASPSHLMTNTFPCWLAMTSETPHRITLYLKLNEPPANPQDYHLQAEIFKTKWELLKEMPFPWSVQLSPHRLMLLGDNLFD